MSDAGLSCRALRAPRLAEVEAQRQAQAQAEEAASADAKRRAEAKLRGLWEGKTASKGEIPESSLSKIKSKKEP